MKKLIGMLLVLAMVLSCLMGGAALADEKKLSVVVTIFPI